jgi:plastocyanin
MRKGVIAILVILLLAGSLIIFTRSNSNKRDEDENKTASSSSAQEPKKQTEVSNTVIIKNFEFTQSKITVKKGATVTWKNEDSAPHTVTFDSEGVSDSKTLELGDSYSATFGDDGDFSYHCSFHSNMTGSVTVIE